MSPSPKMGKVTLLLLVRNLLGFILTLFQIQRKRVPPAGHHNFARNSRQRSHDYCPVPICTPPGFSFHGCQCGGVSFLALILSPGKAPLPYGAAPQKPQTVVAPGGTTAYPPIPSRVHSQAAVYAPAATPTPPGYYPPTPYTQLPPISSSPSSFSSPPPIYY